MDQKYSHSHDAVAVVDRLPLLIMITVSIGFGFFPMHLYNVVRSGVDPLDRQDHRWCVPREQAEVIRRRRIRSSSGPRDALTTHVSAQHGSPE